MPTYPFTSYDALAKIMAVIPPELVKFFDAERMSYTLSPATLDKCVEWCFEFIKKYGKPEARITVPEANSAAFAIAIAAEDARIVNDIITAYAAAGKQLVRADDLPTDSVPVADPIPAE